MPFQRIVTGEIPFKDENVYSVVRKVGAGERPGRPIGVEDKLWNLWDLGWNSDPTQRPIMTKMLESME